MGDVAKFIKSCESELGRDIIDTESTYIREWFKSCNRILDIGCGIGSIEERLFDLEIIGIDKSKEMLIEAKRRSNKTFIQAMAENLPFKNESFDGVFYLTTLEFIPNYRIALKEAYNVLSKNGKFLVMILNPESDYFKEHIKRENSYLRKIRHLDLRKIRQSTSNYFVIRDEYFLGVKGNEIFDTNNREYAALYVIKGVKGEDLKNKGAE
ncbi:MAG TPA: class I SAM-dependent methyltransferase [Candidatus Altiarchaeales archaeon]|nr:class I SAM-dependent methyltransferase [Candidatus Altiarchaeales archaeon]